MRRFWHILLQSLALAAVISLLAVGAAAGCEVCAAHLHGEIADAVSIRGVDRPVASDVAASASASPSDAVDGATSEIGLPEAPAIALTPSVPLRI